MDRFQRDEHSRGVLRLSRDIYEAAVDDGLIGRGGIDWLARCMQELHDEGLIEFSTRNAGTTPSPVWDGAEIQQMHQWRVTAAGRRDASLFRQGPPRGDLHGAQQEASLARRPDTFISHAGEDKAAVARPLADALIALGWDVWLDELRLTVGDSLSRQIDAALARSRFGVVILSPAFFAKEWPQRELSGLAARELASGSKVILPVWHEVDHVYIAERSPTLADRLGARTTAGVKRVADELSVVLRESSPGRLAAQTRMPRGEGSEDGNTDATDRLFRIPVTDDEQASLVEDQPDWWEYRLYAGLLMQGRLRLEYKWHDHDLGLPGGPRRVASEPVWEFVSREFATMGRSLATFHRVFDPDVLKAAFGSPGESGDPDRIKSVARGVIHVYESMLDWAAELRNTAVPSDYVDLFELTARMADGPVGQIRDFIKLVGDQIARIPLATEQAKSTGATAESPMIIELSLTLEVDPVNQENWYAELERLKAM
jgi:hypothetical protein